VRTVTFTTDLGLRLEVDVPETRWERMRGLLRRELLPRGRALLLERTRSVHTVGMRYPIMVARLDRELRVVTVQRMRPGRFLLPRARVRHILECPEGTPLNPGDRLASDGAERRSGS
jgi:uncharacterized membrane protein (UPF0127 family)